MYTKSLENTHLLNGSEHLNVCARVHVCMFVLCTIWWVTLNLILCTSVLAATRGTRNPNVHSSSVFLFLRARRVCGFSKCVHHPIHTHTHTHSLTRTSCIKRETWENEKHKRSIPLFPTAFEIACYLDATFCTYI